MPLLCLSSDHFYHQLGFLSLFFVSNWKKPHAGRLIGRTANLSLSAPQMVPFLHILIPKCIPFTFITGILAVYDLGPSLKSITESSKFLPSGQHLRLDSRVIVDAPCITGLLPTHYITVHQSAIRALVWIRAPPCGPSGDTLIDRDPTVIASGGYDGLECMTDIREARGSVMNRTRGTPHRLLIGLSSVEFNALV